MGYPRNALARAVFFARREDVRAALKRGEYLNHIRAAIGYPGSYSQFARYVERYLASARPSVSSLEPMLPIAPTRDAAAPRPLRRSQSAVRRIEFDPTKLNREDVI